MASSQAVFAPAPADHTSKRSVFGAGNELSSTVPPTTTTNADSPAADNDDESDSNANEDEADVKGKAEAAGAPSATIRHHRTLSDAVKQRMTELEASGWRPEEEGGLFDEEEDDDDDYNAVDLLSDCDYHDNVMRRQEEKSLFEVEQLSIGDDDLKARRFSFDSNDSDNMDYYIAQVDNTFPPLSEFLTSNIDHATNEDILKTFLSGQTSETTATQRRVRFEDELDGSDVASTDSEQVHETFPDLFMAADELGPAHQILEDDDMFLDDGSDAGSCWDFDGDEMHIDLEEDDSTDTTSTLSGYESDDGETTDEEIPPHPSSIPRPQGERPSTANSSTSVNTPSAAARAKNGKSKQKPKSKRVTSPRHPVAGTFMMDPRRPVLIIDGAGRTQHNRYYPARIQSVADKRFWQRLQELYRNRNSSPRMSVQLTPDEEGDFGSQIFDFGEPNAFFNAFGALRPDQISGPPEAFEPFANFDAAGNVVETTSANSGSDDGGEDMMDFLNFDGDEDDDEIAPEESDAAETAWTSTVPFPALTPKNGSRRPSSSDDLLAHLDRHSGLVGSFRRNQQFAKHVGSLASHPSVRASTSEMNAMQTGRRAAANTPITPLRKRRVGKNVGVRTSPLTSPPSRTPSRKKGPVKGGFGGRR